MHRMSRCVQCVDQGPHELPGLVDAGNDHDWPLVAGEEFRPGGAAGHRTDLPVRRIGVVERPPPCAPENHGRPPTARGSATNERMTSATWSGTLSCTTWLPGSSSTR